MKRKSRPRKFFDKKLLRKFRKQRMESKVRFNPYYPGDIELLHKRWFEEEEGKGDWLPEAIRRLL